MTTKRKLACGCFWTPKTPKRCGICDRCDKHCQCDTDGTREKWARMIKNAVQGLSEPTTNRARGQEV